MRIPVFTRRLVAALLLTLPTLPASAAQIELEGGRSYMDSHGTDAAFIESVFSSYPISGSGLDWSPDVSVGWLDGRDVARYRHARYTTHDDIKLIAAGVRFRSSNANAWYHPLFFSFQPTYHSGRTQALSTGYEFISTLGWQEKRWSIQIRHISNGSLHEPNRGETMALVGIALHS